MPKNASQQAEVCGEMQVGPREAHVEARTTSPNRYATTEARKPADCVPVYGRRIAPGVAGVDMATISSSSCKQVGICVAKQMCAAVNSSVATKRKKSSDMSCGMVFLRSLW